MRTPGNILRRLWAAVSETGGPSENAADATAEKLCRVLGRCPVCENGFVDHTYALFATTGLGRGANPLVTEFFNTLKSHRWQDAQKFQEWEPMQDNLEVYTLRCKTYLIALLILHSPHELYESDRLIDYEVLGKEESQELQSVIEQSQWQPIQT